jgi:hypothetical protein
VGNNPQKETLVANLTNGDWIDPKSLQSPLLRIAAIRAERSIKHIALKPAIRRACSTILVHVTPAR